MTASPENPDAIEDLIAGHFDGNLTEQQEAELVQVLTSSTLAKQLFHAYMRMEGRLHSLGRDGYFQSPVIANQNTANQKTANQKTAALSDGAGQLTKITPADQVNIQRLPFTLSQLRKSSRLRATTSFFAACAALVLLLGWVLWPADANANNVLESAQRAAADLIDRAYLITISRGGWQRPIHSHQLMINVRGGRHYVIQSMDGSYTMGSDGTDYWMTQRDGPIWITSDYRKLAPEILRKIPNRHLLRLADSPNEPFMLNVSSLLALIENSYDVELARSTDPAKYHVRAFLPFGRSNQAENIDFWADAKNGTVLRAELTWKNGRRASIQLIDTPPVSERWYHYSQHAGNRPVNRLQATK
ncbi:hypothetical protein N9D23_10710 [Rubripirellula sp.]|jgi:outer membrane lipoprotein-sorting protein|nr:hypothetical protein [Rubripirellula sp.]MDF1843639.1 hypothetical protein [Rubripirellula sp.]